MHLYCINRVLNSGTGTRVQVPKGILYYCDTNCTVELVYMPENTVCNIWTVYSVQCHCISVQLSGEGCFICYFFARQDRVCIICRGDCGTSTIEVLRTSEPTKRQIMQINTLVEDAVVIIILQYRK